MRRLIGATAAATCLSALFGAVGAIPEARAATAPSIEVAPVVEMLDDAQSPSDPAVQARLAQVEADQQVWRAGSKARYATDPSGIYFSYVNGAAPQDVRAVMNQVAADYESVLDVGSAPVEVQFNWTDLGPDVLGSAGPVTLHFYDGAWNAAALVNVLSGEDANGSNPEVVITLNSSFNWNRSTSVGPGRYEFDLYSVALHEMAHGLGFLGAATDQRNDGAGEFTPYLMGYDAQIYYGANQLQSLASPAAYLRSENLTFDLGGGRRQKIHAPTRFVAGSSYSHFDSGAIVYGGPGRLMIPALLAGEANRALDAPVLSVLSQAGWPMLAGAVVPVISGHSQIGEMLEIRWSTDLSQSATAPKSYRITAVPDGKSGVVKVVSGSANRGSVTVSSGGPYQIKVAAIDKNGDSVTGPSINIVVADPGSEGSPKAGPPKDGGDCAQFSDVSDGRFDYKGICYLVAAGVSQGTSPGTYSPDSPITRGQYAVLAHRAAGSPSVVGCDLDFVDVDPTRFDFKGICYLVIRGLSEGTSRTTYSPDAPITRGQYAVLSHRAVGSPTVAECEADAKPPFEDLKKFRFDYRAACWLVATGISQGTSATTYSPDSAITRGQYAALAYRSASS